MTSQLRISSKWGRDGRLVGTARSFGQKRGFRTGEPWVSPINRPAYARIICEELNIYHRPALLYGEVRGP